LLDDGFCGEECGGLGGESLGGENGDTDAVACAFGDRVADLGDTVFGAGCGGDEEGVGVGAFHEGVGAGGWPEGSGGERRRGFEEEFIDADAGLVGDEEGDFVLCPCFSGLDVDNGDRDACDGWSLKDGELLEESIPVEFIEDGLAVGALSVAVGVEGVLACGEGIPGAALGVGECPPGFGGLGEEESGLGLFGGGWGVASFGGVGDDGSVLGLAEGESAEFSRECLEEWGEFCFGHDGGFPLWGEFMLTLKNLVAYLPAARGCFHSSKASK
jgi:hypothetical protein